jgi:inositol 3-alpha-galactosyltransferase
MATTSKNAYVTLLTRPSYLAGAILLAYSLHRHSPSTPLIITYTPDTVGEDSIDAFRAEAAHSNVILHAVSHLRLPEDGSAHGMVAERFIDTWTKLRVFDLHELGFERLCWLDADMMIFSDPSPLVFSAENDAYLRGGDGMRLMATHVCVCNLDHDSWAPADWTPENCALTHLNSPDDIPTVKSEPETFGNFNSGTFVYRPSPALSSFVRDIFDNTPPADLRAMKFPDQDFLNAAFHERWTSLPWSTNALKTWRYWHPNVWRDDRVAVLHYIVDKPWAARVDEDGKAGYLGKDGETHKWWWNEFAAWEKEREGQGEDKLLETVRKYAASKDGKESDEMRAIGGGAQDFAKKFVKGDNAAKDGDDEQAHAGDSVSLPRPAKPLGERGHGRVVRGGRGRGRGFGEGWSVMDP